MLRRLAKNRYISIVAAMTVVTACYGACVAKIKGRMTSADKGTRTSSGRLVVVIVVDQMRPDYLQRFRDQWQASGSDGFSWLESHGVKFLDARTAAAPTVTAAGHASVCTGAVPAVHGIASNDYFDLETKRTKPLVEDAAARLLRTPRLLGNGPLETAPEMGVSPDRLEAKTLGERLKDYDSESKTVTVAIKDRAALLCGGRRNDGAYFFDIKSGSMVTSTALGIGALPSWVDDFNRNNRPETRGDWQLALGDLAPYSSALVPAAQAATERFVRKHYPFMGDSGRFPHRLKPADTASRLEIYPRFTRSPAANDYIVDFALAAIDQKRLGQSDSSDVLVVSFSTPDLIGHGFGIDSLELVDMYVHLNRSLERLRKGIATKLSTGALPSDRVYWVLTADHGIQRIPEALQALGQPGGRIDESAFLSSLMHEVQLERGYDAANFVHSIVTDQIILNSDAIRAAGKSPAQVAIDLADAARRSPDMAYVYTRDKVNARRQDLEKTLFARSNVPQEEQERFLDALARGYAPGISGDVFLVPRRGHQFGYISVSANHGTPWEDDTRIPLIIVAPGVAPGTYAPAAFADDIVPTLLNLLVSPSDDDNGRSHEGRTSQDRMTGRALLTRKAQVQVP